jgi:hypothetical protein
MYGSYLFTQWMLRPSFCTNWGGGGGRLNSFYETSFSGRTKNLYRKLAFHDVLIKPIYS